MNTYLFGISAASFGQDGSCHGTYEDKRRYPDEDKFKSVQERTGYGSLGVTVIPVQIRTSGKSQEYKYEY